MSRPPPPNSSLGCSRDTPSPPVGEIRNGIAADRGESDMFVPSASKPLTGPDLVHRWTCGHSVMSLVCSGSNIVAGTESGEILVFDLGTYQLQRTLSGHSGSVYCLIINSDADTLISGSSDSLIKVWSTKSWQEVYTIYSVYDIGDIFSLAWAPRHETLYFGCQNASIQWIELPKEADKIAMADPSGLPSHRFNKFFDSTGPGGRLAPQQNAVRLASSRRTQSPASTVASRESTPALESEIPEESPMALLEVLPSNVVRFAHNGYVHSMIVTKFASSRNDPQEVLVSGSGDGTVKVWSLNNKKVVPIRSLELDSSVMSLARGSTCDSFVYCGLSSGQLVMYDMDTSQVLRVDKNDSEDVISVCVVDDCVFKACSGTVQKWDPTNYSRCEWNAHDGLALALVATDYNGRRILVTGGNDSTIGLWDISQLLSSRATASTTALNAYANLLREPNSRRGSAVVALDNDHMIRTLTEFVSYKTVSGASRYWSDCRRCASYLRNLLEHFGAQSSLLPVNPDRNPIVYGHFKGHSTAERKRILFYGHYDVIAAHQTDKWDTDPFVLTAKDGYMYGRGVSDNKGPILAAIFAVAELFQSGRLENDVVFIIEGEEESGSVGFISTLENNRSLIGDIDWIILSNSYWLDDNTPCLNYGLRGIINATVKIDSGMPDLHSGVHGGVFLEPTMDMINVLSKLRSDAGEILVPNFYKSVRPVSPAEEQLYEAITHTPGFEHTKETLMKRWRYPSLTVHGINVSGPGNTTVIPASVEATISFRIVPDQDIDVIRNTVKGHIEQSFASLASDNKLTICFTNEAEPWLGDPSNKAFQILRSAISDEWNGDPLFIREGGSIPVVRCLEKHFNASAAQLPCGQASDGAHLNNERLRILNFFKTRNVLSRFFRELS